MKDAITLTVLVLVVTANASPLNLGGISGPALGKKRAIPPARMDTQPQQDELAEIPSKEQPKEEPQEPNEVQVEHERLCHFIVQALLQRLPQNSHEETEQKSEQQEQQQGTKLAPQPPHIYPKPIKVGGAAPTRGQIGPIFEQYSPLQPQSQTESAVGPPLESELIIQSEAKRPHPIRKPLPFPPIINEIS